MGENIVGSLKKKWLPVYGVLAAATGVLLVGLMYLYAKTGANDYSMAAMVDSLFLLYILWSIYKLAKLEFKPRKVVTLVRCEKCGYSEERDYARGDYLFKVKGQCPKCGAPLLVAGIYVKEAGEEEPDFTPLPLPTGLATFITTFSGLKRGD